MNGRISLCLHLPSLAGGRPKGKAHFFFCHSFSRCPKLFNLFKLVREMKKLFLYAVVLFTASLFSCKRTPEPLPPVEAVKYGQGIFIVNEGPFQTGTGTLTFYDRDTKVVTEDVFMRANDGKELGNIAQSMNVIDDKAYIVVNNAGKVVVADGETLVKTGEISGLGQPRYVLDLGDGRVAVSQWGADGLSGSVALVNAGSLAIEATIATGAGAEGMLLKDGKLYVANSGGYGVDSTVAVIDLSDNSVSHLVVGRNPSGIVEDANGNIWVLCSGYNDWNDPNNPLNAPGKLLRLENGQEAFSIDLPVYSGDLNISEDGSILYLLVNSEPYGMHISSTALPSESITHGQQGIFYYSLGLDPVTGYLLAGNAKDYISAGEVDVFQDDGTKMETISAGIIPGGYFAR